MVAAQHALDRCELVVSSGGLGPTLDDLTREAVAELLSRKLVLNSSVLQNIEARFRRLGRTMPEVNKRQANVHEMTAFAKVEGATIIYPSGDGQLFE